MKFNPALAGYLAAAVAAGIIVWWITNKLDFGLGKVGEGLDQITDSVGDVVEAKAFNDASAEYAPQLLYAQARGDYARSLGMGVITKMDFSKLPDWPDYDHWLNGEGPLGFTYGSVKYPKPVESSWSNAFWNNF